MSLSYPFKQSITFCIIQCTVDTGYLCVYFIDHQPLLFAAHSTTMLLDQDLALQWNTRISTSKVANGNGRTHYDVVRSSFWLSHNLHPFSHLWRAWLIIVEIFRLNAYSEHLPLVNIHTFGDRRIEELLRHWCLGVREPEVRTFVWIARKKVW